MIDFLLGVPGKLKTITDYLTTHLASARAAKIDNLDATISTRAAASTALSTANWTNARAGYLDKINIDPTRDPPIAAGFTTSITDMGDPHAGFTNLAAAVAGTLTSLTAAATYTIINVTGSGVLNFAAMQNAGITQTVGFSLIIDGITVATASASLGSGGHRVIAGVYHRHSGATDSQLMVGIDQIPFKSSLVFTVTTSSTQPIDVITKYRRTS